MAEDWLLKAREMLVEKMSNSWNALRTNIENVVPGPSPLALSFGIVGFCLRCGLYGWRGIQTVLNRCAAVPN